MITRQQYMNGEATHDEYYREIYRELGLSFLGSPDWIKRIERALLKGDEYLNTIQNWDALAYSYIDTAHARKVFKDHGDGYSLAGMVCALKRAAKDAIERSPAL